MILSIGICRIRCSEKYTENRSFVGGATNRNQDLAEWEQAVKNGQKPAEKQHRPPEKQSVRNRLRQPSGREQTELSAEAEKEIPRQGQIITT